MLNTLLGIFKCMEKIINSGNINDYTRPDDINIILAENSELVIKGTHYFDKGAPILFRSSLIQLKEHSRLIIEDNFKFYYGADILIFEGGILELGSNSFINSYCEIRCKKRIKVGKDCAIGRHFCALDSDFHKINGVEHASEIIIGNHVWIAQNVTILKGVKVGDGAIIGAGSIVTKDVPSRCMVVGNPARIIKENVEWE
ncbi:Acetyltransferase (isoleucine patch superfamily) [Pseudobutyrivibrio sp. C4]|nr:acyltransferase [Pseudobutyrivibrio sp. C4]SET12772.1 Acetyltransferase (isoleucine patch superfamily) [Pseudobutyrivibrio sp. C4]